nr:Lmo0654 family protein [Listeria sp. ILCC792]
MEVSFVKEDERKELEDRLIDLKHEYQNLVADSRDFEDPQLQNGPMNAAEVRLSSIRHEIKKIEKHLKKDPIE